MVTLTNTTTAPAAGENYSALEGSFEGPEKLLEIWFSPSSESLKEHQDLPSDDSDDELVNQRRRSYALISGQKGLRVIPKPVLDKMLALVKCTVLNVISTADVDAYLLR